MSEWRVLVRKYLLALQSSGRSNNTLEISARWLKSFMAWCEPQGLTSPSAVGAAHIEAFRQHLKCAVGGKGNPYTPRGIDLALRVLRKLFTWAAKRDLIAFSPTADLILGRIQSELPTQLSLQDMVRLLEVADDRSLLGQRDRAVLETFYSTGLRLGELVALSLSDLDLEERRLRVWGKDSRERFAPVGDALAAVLERYLTDCRTQLVGHRHELALFVSGRGTRWHENGLRQMVTRVGERAGLSISPHSLRHAFAVHMLECGADFYEVQALLGHLSPKSTQIYAHIAVESFRRQYRRFHPRSGRLTQGDTTP